MPRFRWQAPFAEFHLEIEAVSNVKMVRDATIMRPVLPGGMRINDCRLCAVSVDCNPGDNLTIRLEIQPEKGWAADFSSGEYLDAFELENSVVGTAAVGMRDPEWLCDRYGLVCLDANRPTDRNHFLTARYKALSGTKVDIQAAYAWINNPKTDQEAFAPWYAVDLAMFS